MPNVFVDVSELEDMSSRFYDIANRVANVAKWLKDAGMTQAHIDVDSVRNTYLRKSTSWAIKLTRKIEADIVDFKDGRELQSVVDQRKNAKSLKKRKQQEKEKK